METRIGRSLNVLHVIPGLSAGSGGPRIALIGMCRALEDRGCAVQIATTDSGRDDCAELTNTVGFSLRCFRSPFLGKYGYSAEMRAWLRDHVGEHDVVHIHALFAYSSVVAARCAQRAGVPYILRPAGQLDEWSLKQTRAVKKLFLSLIGLSLLRRAGVVHATTKFEHDAVHHLDRTLDVAVVPHGVDIPDSLPARTTTPDTVQILFLSRIDPKKGIPTLLRAIRILVDQGLALRLVLAGDGDPRFVGEITSLVTNLRLETVVTMPGFVSGLAKDGLLKESHLFVLPSRDENFGVAVAEALAYGVPVVLSDRVGLAAAVSRWDAGLITPVDDPVALSSALERLVTDARIRSQMAENARTAAHRELSWSKTGEGLLAMYARIAATSR